MAGTPRTVEEYIASLPGDRRAALQAVREVILGNLDGGYEEGIQYGAIGYYVPHRVYPPGYHCDPKQPLPFASLASRKDHLSLGLMCVYGSPGVAERFRKEWASTGKRLDMGAACIRFRKPEDLALEVIGRTIARVPAAKYIEHCEAALRARGKKEGKGRRKA